MKNLAWLYIKYLIYWLLVFVLGRACFLFVNWFESSKLSFSTLLSTFFHGFRLDLSMSAYLVLIPFLTLSLSLLLIKRKSQILQSVLHFLLFLPAIVIVAIDAQLFRYWGFKLDLTPFRFLENSPSDAAASIRFVDILLVALVLGFLAFVGVLLYRKMLVPAIKKVQAQRTTGLLGLLLTAFLFLPIRGSIDVSPVNVSSAYFHRDFFPNQAAINPVWNFMYSLSIKDQDVVLDLATKEDALKAQQQLFQASDSISIPSLRYEKPNIIILVLESFSAKIVGALSETKGLTPRLDSLCNEGLLFTNYYASGDRSDIGLATMFTGFPAMPNKHLLAFPQKLQTLPNLYSVLGDSGYRSSFYYGGNLEFANIKSLFVTGGVDRIISQKEMRSFPDDGKWGVHDHHVFKQFGEDLAKEKSPFISALFSLSSHEPYKVPVDYGKFDGKLADFNNATYYTDSCLGALIDDLKRNGVWEQSLVIVTADHGTRMPDMSEVNDPKKFKIPLLLTGGAMLKKGQENQHCSQSDLAYSILQLLQYPVDQNKFPFSKSIFDPSKDFALYYYNNGVGYVDKKGFLVYDITGDYTKTNMAVDSAKYETLAKQMTQAVYENFRNR